MLLIALAVAVVAAAVLVGLRQAAPDPGARAGEPAGSFDLDDARRRLRGAPRPLARLHAQANELLTGGPAEFARRLDGLEGHPVVINKWASWCGPCRAEAPVLQELGVREGRRVAFLGVDWRDSRESARDFLDRHGLPFPSYEDPDGEIADELGMPANIPVTLFLDERGRLAYLHQGGYRNAEDLAADIDRYLPAP